MPTAVIEKLHKFFNGPLNTKMIVVVCFVILAPLILVAYLSLVNEMLGWCCLWIYMGVVFVLMIFIEIIDRLYEREKDGR